MEITEEIKAMAKLARLDLEDQELEEIASESAELLKKFEALQKFEGVEEAHFLQGSSPLREDFSSASENAAKIMEQVPFKRGSFVKAPKGLKK